MDERVFYQQGDILVTNTRLVIGARTFALRNLASVEMGIIEKKPSLLIGFILMLGLGLLIFGSWGTKVFGLGCLAIVVFYIKSMRPKFIVRIESNAGTIDAIASQDRSYIESVVVAINEAIMANH